MRRAGGGGVQSAAAAARPLLSPARSPQSPKAVAPCQKRFGLGSVSHQSHHHRAAVYGCAAAARAGIKLAPAPGSPPRSAPSFHFTRRTTTRSTAQPQWPAPPSWPCSCWPHSVSSGRDSRNASGAGAAAQRRRCATVTPAPRSMHGVHAPDAAARAALLPGALAGGYASAQIKGVPVSCGATA